MIHYLLIQRDTLWDDLWVGRDYQTTNSMYSKEKKQIDLTESRKFVVSLIPKAGEILMGYFRSGQFSSRSKGGLDFVTQADEEVDQFLREILLERFPTTKFLTEETAPEDFLSLKDVENLWVIDPLDGTGNFSRGHPNFAISIALVSKTVTLLGVVFTPVDQKLYWAQADLNTAILNDQPIRVSDVSDLSKAVFLCDFYPIPELRIKMRQTITRVESDVRQIKAMGSAVADLCQIAEGKADAYIQPGLKPWDVAAASLIISKAGGRITRLDGRDWDVFTPDIFASNNLLHTTILKLVA